ncbi:sigma-54-dependent Fis family transcriptional regulator [Terrimonas sp. NA20]|uniref:Sigma-54-dependent Fis family transcriptional regulator n=1 Tax=Terrimonas ginsenosidimutans TaxID=2908004 RepID=A0ABS9KKI4_9BACT|nr:sigma-54-dependent Fis family transcriptional regulator [Terrimonas ginsenosidimutans]MCG2612828.1 sigma-54-dependent Fis family transcriptional regulator [Terrimonas ginsenosidimutans]
MPTDKKNITAPSNPRELLAQLQRKEQEQSLLLSLNSRMAAVRTRSDLWELVSHELLQAFNAKYYTLCLINEDGETHSPFLHSRERISTLTDENPIIHSKHPIADSIFDTTLRETQPLVHDLRKVLQRKNAPPYIVHWFNAGIAEMLTVKIDGLSAKGVLYFYAAEKGTFTDDQFSLLTAIANQLAIASANILANEQLTKSLEDLEQLKQKLEQENHYLQERILPAGNKLIGESAAVNELRRLIAQVAPSSSTILIQGETGTGKEVVASTIHENSPRKDRLMIRVNCAAIPETLIESELFGHEKGSFTNATQQRIGKFELASGSTIFLDEIGELPLLLQSKLLRVIQEKEIERIGGNQPVKVDVRIIAATNRDLQAEVQKGRFRGDLFFRLNVVPLHLQPLRNRKEDIAPLTNYFLSKYSHKNAGITISAKVLKLLESYQWPGNIRELEHLVERTVLLLKGKSITEISLPTKQVRISPAEDSAIQTLAMMEREYILKVLDLCHGRISGPNGAAMKLGLPATTLISKMQKLGIKKEHVSMIDGR